MSETIIKAEIYALIEQLVGKGANIRHVVKNMVEIAFEKDYTTAEYYADENKFE